MNPVPGGSVDGIQSNSNTTLEMEKLLRFLTSMIKPSEHKKLSKKLWKKFNNLKADTETAQFRTNLCTLMEQLTAKLTDMKQYGNGLAGNWSEIGNFSMYLENPAKIHTYHEDQLNAANPEVTDLKKEKKLKRLEKKLKKLSDIITKLDQEEVDWDDLEQDHNSAYLRSDRAKAMIMKIFYQACESGKFSKLVGRPVQMRLDITSMSRYPEFEKPIQDFINSKGSLFAPDYNEIRDIISNICESQRQTFHFNKEQIGDIAKEFLQLVMAKIQKRRGQDFLEVFNNIQDFLKENEQPDTELLKKLDENKALQKDESEIIDHYAKLQDDEKQKRIESKEVKENGNAAIESGDDCIEEDDDEDEDEEEEDDDDEFELLSDTESTASSSLPSALVKGVAPEDEPLYENEGDSDAERTAEGEEENLEGEVEAEEAEEVGNENEESEDKVSNTSDDVIIISDDDIVILDETESSDEESVDEDEPPPKRFKEVID